MDGLTGSSGHYGTQEFSPLRSYSRDIGRTAAPVISCSISILIPRASIARRLPPYVFIRSALLRTQTPHHIH